MSCPCGAGPALEICCGPYLDGAVKPATAEALMRSRYTAFAVQNLDYVFSTNDPSTVGKLDRESTEKWSHESTWHGLEIISTEDGGQSDDRGKVEFIASFTYEDELQRHHELAEFRRIDKRWYYHDGRVRKGETVVRDEPKIGRNDPCPCGSGKKYKKCCGSN